MNQPEAGERISVAASASGAPKRPWKERLRDEGKRLLGIFLYFYILLVLFSLHETIVLAQHHIFFWRYGFALINAYVLAKVMLVAEDLNFGRRFENPPLAYSILLKSVTFTLVFVCFHLLERVIVGAWRGRPLAESLAGAAGGSVWIALSTAVIMAFALIPYFAYQEVARMLGRDTLRELLFARQAKGEVRRAHPPLAGS